MNKTISLHLARKPSQPDPKTGGGCQKLLKTKPSQLQHQAVGCCQEPLKSIIKHARQWHRRELPSKHSQIRTFKTEAKAPIANKK